MVNIASYFLLYTRCDVFITKYLILSKALTKCRMSLLKAHLKYKYVRSEYNPTPDFSSPNHQSFTAANRIIITHFSNIITIEE